MGFHIDAACVCNKGLIRSNNEDNFFFFGKILPYNNSGTNGIITLQEDIMPEMTACVFDGIGGGEYGEIASYTAAKSTQNYLSNNPYTDYESVWDYLEGYVNCLNVDVVSKAEQLTADTMGSTMVSLHFIENSAYICNLGDSKCFRFSDGNLIQLSDDHTDGEFLASNGIVNRKPSLIQYLGINPRELMIEPSIKKIPLNRKEQFLLCSDGLTDMVPPSSIKACLNERKSAARCVEELLTYALNGGGKDNITIMVCKIR